MCLCTVFLLGAVLIPHGALAGADIAAAEQQIKKKFALVMPGFEVQSVAPSAIDGLFDVQMANGPLLIVTPTAEYFISGDLFTTAPRANWRMSARSSASASA